MFYNFNRKKPNEEEFFTALVQMFSEDSFSAAGYRTKEYKITTSELKNQIRSALLDVFTVKVYEEENNTLTLHFPNRETFKLKLTKE